MTPEQAQAFSAHFLATLEHEIQTTRRVLSAMPETQLDFKLGDKGRTARQLMWHLVYSEKWFADGVAAGEFAMEEEPPAPATVAEIVAFFDRELPPRLERLKGLAGEQLTRTINFFNAFHLPAVGYLDFWIRHTVHHRGQLSTYLRAMNARVPDIYGGSADEPFQMPATA